MVSGFPPSYSDHMSVFRTFLCTVWLVAAILSPAYGDAPGQAFEEVIAGQISAFAQDDGPAAFAFASPDIQQQFGTAERFMEMVRAGFQPVYRPRSYSFEIPIRIDGTYAQPVRIIDRDGRGVIALYRMQRLDDGSWRIAGVTLHPIAERGI